MSSMGIGECATKGRKDLIGDRLEFCAFFCGRDFFLRLTSDRLLSRN
jgi:hypothetical protein